MINNYSSHQLLRREPGKERVNSQQYLKELKANVADDMPYYMKQRQKNLIFASNSLEKISARSNSTSLVSYPPGFQPQRAKRLSPGGNSQQAAPTMKSRYELSRVHMAAEGTGSSKELPDDSPAEYKNTSYFGAQKSTSPTMTRQRRRPDNTDEQNPYDIRQKVLAPSKKSEQHLPALPSGRLSPDTSIEQAHLKPAKGKQWRYSSDSPISAQQY